MAVKALTEAIFKGALATRDEALTDIAVAEMCRDAGVCSKTFYRSQAYADFKTRLAGPPKRATKGTRETMAKLRATIELLANCVQSLSLTVEEQQRELDDLRSRVHDNVTVLHPRSRSDRTG